MSFAFWPLVSRNDFRNAVRNKSQSFVLPTPTYLVAARGPLASSPSLPEMVPYPHLSAGLGLSVPNHGITWYRIASHRIGPARPLGKWNNGSSSGAVGGSASMAPKHARGPPIPRPNPASLQQRETMGEKENRLGISTRVPAASPVRRRQSKQERTRATARAMPARRGQTPSNPPLAAWRCYGNHLPRALVGLEP